MKFSFPGQTEGVGEAVDFVVVVVVEVVDRVDVVSVLLANVVLDVLMLDVDEVVEREFEMEA